MDFKVDFWFITGFWPDLAKFADFCKFDNSLCLFPFFIVFPVILSNRV